MDELKNAIRLSISGYIHETTLTDDDDEFDRLIEMPGLLRELADKYQKEQDEWQAELDKSYC